MDGSRVYELFLLNQGWATGLSTRCGHYRSLVHQIAVVPYSSHFLLSSHKHVFIRVIGHNTQ